MSAGGEQKAFPLPPTHMLFVCHKRTGFWDVRRARHAPDLLHGLQVRAQPPVHRENFPADDRGDGQAVEALREKPPELDVVTPLAYINGREGRGTTAARERECVSFSESVSTKPGGRGGI